MLCPWCNKPMKLRNIPVQNTSLPNKVKLANFDKTFLVSVCFNDDCSEYIRINKKN